jgi:hypothetical protein
MTVKGYLQGILGLSLLLLRSKGVVEGGADDYT